MASIYKQDSATVGYRESQVRGDPGFIQAVNQTPQLEATARQSQQQLQAYQEQSGRNANFAQNNLARNQRIDEQNAALSSQILNANNQLDAEALRLDHTRKLAAMGLNMEQTSRAQQIQLNQARIQSEQITNFGESFIKFSETLWNKRAEQINKENDDLRLKGVLHELNNIHSPAVTAEVAKQNQLEIQRTQGAAKAEAAAQLFDQQGRPNEATLIRTNNPFFLQGQAEGRAINASLKYQDYLDAKVSKAFQDNKLSKLSPSYQLDIGTILDMSTAEYIKENDLLSVPPSILYKYFGYQQAQVKAAILQKYNGEARNEVERALKSVAVSTVYNRAKIVRTMSPNDQSNELRVLMANTTTAYRGNHVEAGKAVLETLFDEAKISGNADLLTRFMNTDQGNGYRMGDIPELQPIYDQKMTAFNRAQAALLEDQAQQQVESVKGNWDGVLATGDVGQIRQARDTLIAQALSLRTPEGNALAKDIATYNTERSPLIDEAVRRAIDGNYLPQFLRDNKGRMSKEQFDKLSNQSKLVAKLKETSYKSALDTLKAEIAFAAGEANKERQGKGALAPYATRALNEFVKIQQQKVEGFSKDWLIQNPSATVKDYQDWLKSQKPTFTHSWQYEIHQEHDMPKGMISLGQDKSTIPLVRNETIGGKTYLNLLHPKIQRGLADGSIPARGLVRSDSLVFTPQQIKQAGDQFEATGTWPTFVTDITSRSGNDAFTLIKAQAKLHRMPGSIVMPGNYSLPTSSSGQGVSYNAVVQFGKANRMSERGAIAFATMVKDESSGNPRNIGDGGDSFGLMQWNKRYSPDRVKRLNDFATQFGKPVTDPAVQLNYALYELQNFYPSAWEVLKSPNPTTNQLFRATVQYLGFDKSLEKKREASLEANLR
jgi:hypothetical protein